MNLLDYTQWGSAGAATPHAPRDTLHFVRPLATNVEIAQLAKLIPFFFIFFLKILSKKRVRQAFVEAFQVSYDYLRRLSIVPCRGVWRLPRAQVIHYLSV